MQRYLPFLFTVIQAAPKTVCYRHTLILVVDTSMVLEGRSYWSKGPRPCQEALERASHLPSISRAAGGPEAGGRAVWGQYTALKSVTFFTNWTVTAFSLSSQRQAMGISRDNWCKCHKTRGKRKPCHRKGNWELGHPAAN